jgi:hypothetical protein
MNKEHIYKLIDFLYQEVLSSGGDGDALWYSKYYSLDDLLEVFQEFNDDYAVDWRFTEISDTGFNWGDNQEGITVTTSKEYFENSPDWMQIKVVY